MLTPRRLIYAGATAHGPFLIQSPVNSRTEEPAQEFRMGIQSAEPVRLVSVRLFAACGKETSNPL